MASNYHIQKPYVLASLPRSVTQPDGTSVVCEVYGHRPGAKKRRRPEVVVGIDGESVNLYDVAGSRLITSYPIPPQAKIFCPPCSVRIRASSSKNTEFARYTYVATREPARKLSLFKDTVESSAATSSSTVTTNLERDRSSDIIFLSTTTSTSTGLVSEEAVSADRPPLVAPDLLAVDREGQVTCFNGETLKVKYKASLAELSQDALPRGSVVRVDFAQLGPASDVLKGLALGENYFSGVFPNKIEADSFNPDFLTIISHISGRQGVVSRYLHVLAVNPNPASRSNLAQVHHIRLPALDSASGHGHAKPLYRLDMPSGSLFSLEDDAILSYDLSRSIPRILSHMSIPGATSFLRLSKSSVLVATPTSFSVYNPIFKSLQVSTAVDIRTEEGQLADALSSSFFLFFSQLELAIAVVDNNLVAVQLEPPKARSRKRRADGLLIDSIGRGVGQPAQDKDSAQEGIHDTSLQDSTCVPGTVSARYLAQYWEDIQTGDRFLEEEDVAGFDNFLAEKFGIQDSTEWHWERPLDAKNDAVVETQDDDADPLANGVTNDEAGAEGDVVDGQNKLSGLVSAPTRRDKYPEADRRWIVYAISCVLAIEQSKPSDTLNLVCKLPTSDILNYLVDAGHLSVSNTLSALRPSLQGLDDTDLFVGESLPILLAGLDPSLDLLLRWLYATKLGATELLSAILLLMRSLELVVDATRALKTPLLLTNGTHSDDEDNDKEMDDSEGNKKEGASAKASANGLPQENELDQLDEQLHLAEYFLQQVENDPRDLALDIAIGKLSSCPPVATVQALRRIFKTDEIRSLIEVLRKQLVDQGWATRYVDMGEEEGEEPVMASGSHQALPGDSATPLDYSIRFIADLLCRCIDAVRPSEWLIDDDIARVANDGEVAPQDLFASLKWQVSAALEGVQEALYLRGLIGEAVRYATGVQKMEAAAAVAAARAVARGDESKERVRPVRLGGSGSLVTAQGPVVGMLPLGLKAPVNLPRHPDIAPTKVTRGGEVIKRSKRELGYLSSKKIAKYTMEGVDL